MLQGVSVTLKPAALDALRGLCLADLSNGGRGIRNKLEAHLVNPLARAVFDADGRPGSWFVVEDIVAGPVTTLRLVSATGGH
jgi:hypothetical protein